MRIGILGFCPQRLTEARNARGMTKVSLAALIDKSSGSISRWESGVQAPETSALEKLSTVLNLPISFFLSSGAEHGDLPMFYRTMSSTTKAVRERTEVRMRWAQNISLGLQKWVDLPELHLPYIDTKDYRSITNSDIEKIAATCRAEWEIGNGPIPDLLLVLENAGIIVIKEEVGCYEMDGLSNWSLADNRPYIYISQDKDSCVRSRLNAAHELGHLVLHRHIDKNALTNKNDFKEIERQAFHFAGAFLMPAESFGIEISSVSLNTFVALKERWKTSIGSMIMRCMNLGIITESYYTQLFKYYSSRGWRKNEPFDDVMPSENPRLLSRSIQLLSNSKIMMREQLINEFHLSKTDIETLTGLPRGYMSGNSAHILNFPKLKPTKTTESTDNFV